MFVVTVLFEVAVAHVAGFRAAVIAQAANSLAQEAGCLRFDVCLDEANATRVFLYEIYSDAEAFERHLASAHFREFDARTHDWVTSKTVETWQLVPPEAAAPPGR